MIRISFSGGKDSAAMLLEMIERGYEIDSIDFADPLFEFSELYTYLDTIDEHIGEVGYKINRIEPEEGLWDKWFYGKTGGKGENAGKVRGMPLRLFPCWWTREAKVKPLSKLAGKEDTMCVGIAYDEKERMSSVDGNLIYPLVEWGWTEGKCAEYLNEKSLFNPLYVNFDRLGCYHCQKQSMKSLWVLWKIYPELWDEALYWDNESLNVAGHGIKEEELTDIQKKFETGWKPKHIPKYDCWNGCDSVKNAFKQKQQGLGYFCD